jgi:hypothetical protein
MYTINYNSYVLDFMKYSRVKKIKLSFANYLKIKSFDILKFYESLVKVWLNI